MFSKTDRVIQNLKNSNINNSVQIVFIINNSDDLVAKPVIFANTIIDDQDITENEKLHKKISKVFYECHSTGITDELLKNSLKSKVRSVILKDYGIRPLTSIRIVRI